MMESRKEDDDNKNVFNMRKLGFQEIEGSEMVPPNAVTYSKSPIRDQKKSERHRKREN